MGRSGCSVIGNMARSVRTLFATFEDMALALTINSRFYQNAMIHHPVVLMTQLKDVIRSWY
jgi:hypothetical protein